LGSTAMRAAWRRRCSGEWSVFMGCVGASTVGRGRVDFSRRVF
jgi:hypothetical protein